MPCRVYRDQGNDGSNIGNDHKDVERGPGFGIEQAMRIDRQPPAAGWHIEGAHCLRAVVDGVSSRHRQADVDLPDRCV